MNSTGRLQDINGPRDREGQFHTQAFERYSRYDPLRSDRGEAAFDARLRQSLRRGENSLLLGAGKKKKGKRSLSYLVQSTFLSESHQQAY